MTEHQHLETLSDIKRMMERSSRFISLSGLSGIFAGVIALAGAWIADGWLTEFDRRSNTQGYLDLMNYDELLLRLIILGLLLIALALAGGTYFTWRRAKRNNLPVWDLSSRNVLINALIPMCTGGAFIVGLLYNHLIEMVGPACLVFYGLALVNASKYTLSDIRYLGIAEIILGILNVFYLRSGIIFWALGFGVLHILYGAIMWWKYERQPLASA
jgi:hypothetical protein